MNAEIIEDSGVVTAVDGKYTTVEIVRGGGCKSCSMQGFCFKKSTPAQFVLTTELDLKTGDKVQLEISPGGRTMASLLVFGLPIAFLFAGFLVAEIWLTELASIAVAFTIMVLGFLTVRLLDKSISKRLSIRIARKL